MQGLKIGSSSAEADARVNRNFMRRMNVSTLDCPDAIAVTDIYAKWDSVNRKYISMRGGSVEQDFDVSVSVVLSGRD